MCFIRTDTVALTICGFFFVFCFGPQASHAPGSLEVRAKAEEEVGEVRCPGIVLARSSKAVVKQ